LQLGTNAVHNTAQTVLIIFHQSIRAALIYSATHVQEGMIQLFAAAKCPKMDIHR